MIEDSTPILVGTGRITDRDTPLDALPGPIGLMQRAAEAAREAAGLAADCWADLDTVAVVKSFRESARNSPLALARRLGAANASGRLLPDGGNGPQYLVNRYCETIARGEARFVLLAGAEAKDSVRRLKKAGLRPDWSEPPDSDPDWLIADQPMGTPHEQRHGVWLAALVYPLFETALRGHYGHTIDAHQQAMGELFARFAAVAAETPGAWFPTRRSAREIATAGPGNRYVGWPYTKFMNAMNHVDQSAALLLTSVGEARRRGIDPARWLFLHGCADTQEPLAMSEREAFHACPAIRVMGERALAMAGRSLEEIDLFDLYSCFPSAVAIARDELGLAADDPRPLTVTGGLPYHGGAGNNYVMSAIARMAERLRAEPGRFGMVTANGGYLTKHAAGIYSHRPIEGPWRREDPARYQAGLDARPRPAFVEAPDGAGVIETYTVAYGREGQPEAGILYGRLGDGGDPMAPRFLANTPADPDLLAAMTREDFLGARGRVAADGRINRFTPA